MELYILGPFQVRLDGQPVTTFESNKVRALLAYLAAESARSQPRERLAGLLWPDWPQQSAMSNLRYALADLRKNIGDRKTEASGLLAHPPNLLISRDSLQLNPAADIHVDVDEFEQGIRDRGQGIEGKERELRIPNPQSSILNQQSSILNLQSAIALYRGPFLEGFSLSDSAPFEEWLLAKREYFSQMMLDALQRLAGHFEQSREYEQAKGYAQRQLDLEPWREEAHQQLMRLLALSGQRSAALAQYDKCRRALKDGLGVDPGAETTALYERIRSDNLSPARLPLQAQPPPSLTSFSPASSSPERSSVAPPLSPAPLSPASVPLPRHNLPRQLTRLIGREQEIAQVTELVRQTPLVTLTGSGGVGKTRLALAAAEGLLDDFKDGVWLVDLAPVTDASLVPQVLAGPLGVREDPGRPVLEKLSAYFRRRETLLVLDNCEHLIEACAGLAITLLSAAPQLKMLATSREALGVPGETAYRVPSLAFPPPGQALDVEAMQQYEAVRLFFDRARAAMVDFQLTPGIITSVGQICQRLDGIPLAIELAAARASSLDVTQIAERLDQAFRLLAGGSRAALERHRTLRATVDWSYNLLLDTERLLLPRLSVFAGGWTLEAAEGVCAGDGIVAEEVLILLSRLVNKSMLQVERPSERGVRYRMLETIRQYAAEILSASGKRAALSDRHAAWIDQFVAVAGPKLQTGERLVWNKILDAEEGNLRAALAWTLEVGAHPEAGLRIANTLLNYWFSKGRWNESCRWLEKGLETLTKSASLPPLLEARTLNSLAILGCDNPAVNQKRLLKVLALCEGLGAEGGLERARAQSFLGWLEAGQFGNLQQGLSLLKVSERFYREQGQAGKWDLTLLLAGEVWVLQALKDIPAAQACAEESWALAQETGDIWAAPDWALGDLAMGRGEFSLARQYYEKMNAVNLEIGNGTAEFYEKMGILEKTQDKYDRAAAFFRQALKEYADSTKPHDSLQTLQYIAFNEIALAASGNNRSHLLTAARLLGLDEKLREEQELPVFIMHRLEYEQAIAALHAQLDQASLEAAWAEGRAFTLEQAVAYALEVSQ